MLKFMSREAGSAFGGNILRKSLSLVIFGSFLLAAAPALAYSPSLSVYSSGSDNTTISVSGSQPNSQITLYYTPSGSSLKTSVSNFGLTDYSGNFSTNVSSSAYGFSSGSQVYVVVAGQQSNTVNYNYSSGGCNYYNNCNLGQITLSQSNLNLSVGQSSTVAVYSSNNNYNNNYYISSNSNSTVATVSVSGSSVYVYANQSGSTNISVCQTGNSGCATLYVTVSGSNSCTYNCGALTFSQNNVSLNAGQSSTVYVYANSTGNSSNYYISSNSNYNVVSATIINNAITLSAQNSGSSNIYVCQYNSNTCAYLYVTVNGSVAGATNYQVYINDNFYSPQTITITAGSSITWKNNGNMAHTVTFDNPYSDSGTINPGGTYTKTFYTNGTYSYHCNLHSGMTGSVVVTGSASGTGNVWFSPSNPTMYAGQSLAVSINSQSLNSNYYGSNAYYVSSNSNSSAVSASVSGTVLNLYAYQNGSSNITVCHSSLGYCGTLYVTVYGNSNNNTGSLYFTTTNLPAMVIGQYYSYQLQASGGTSPYTYSLVSGSLPAGLSLNYNGTISGVPNSGVFSSFTVRVNDNSNRTSTANFNMGTTGGGLQYPGGVLGSSTYQNGQLISENGTVYVVYKNTKTGFVSASVFTSFGFSFDNVLNAGNSGLNDSGYVIRSANTSHPWGSWVKSGQTVYFVHESGLIPVPDWNTFVNNGGQGNLIVNANSYDFNLPTLTPMSWGDARVR